MDYVKIINKIDSIVYSMYNFCAMSKFAVTYPFINRIIGKNKQYFNKHKGERCFILGLGTSLNNVDLSLLKNETTFAVNSFHRISENALIEPTYYFLMDQCFYLETINETEMIINKFPNSQFFSNFKAKKYYEKKFGKQSNLNYLYSRHIQHDKKINYNASKNMTAATNVIPCCIQMALYMGFSEIYLLGCDFNYVANRLEQKHCYNENEEEIKTGSLMQTVSFPYQRIGLVFAHHDALAIKAKNLNVKILNATEGSFLTSYEFADFNKIINTKKE